MIVDASDGITLSEPLLPALLAEEPTEPAILLAPNRIESRAVAATLTCIARVGLTKTTLDDVAREAGCGRATLYRYFGSRAALIELAVRTELLTVADRIRRRVAAVGTLEAALTVILVGAASAYDGSAALETLLAHDRGAVLPFVTFRGKDRLLELAADVLAPDLERFFSGSDVTDPAARARRCAAWTTRVALTYLLARDRPFDLTDEESARTLVSRFVLPAFAPAPTPR